MTEHSGSSQMRKEKECLWLCGMTYEFVNVGKERAGLSPVVPQLQPINAFQEVHIRMERQEREGDASGLALEAQKGQ